MKIQKIMEAYRKTGRIAFYYPRKKKISLDGGRLLSINEAVEKMENVLNKVTLGLFKAFSNATLGRFQHFPTRSVLPLPTPLTIGREGREQQGR